MFNVTLFSSKEWRLFILTRVYQWFYTVKTLILQYRSKVSYHRLERRVSFLARLVSKQTRWVSRETRRVSFLSSAVSFLSSALEVPTLRIRRYSKPVLSKTSICIISYRLARYTRFSFSSAVDVYHNLCVLQILKRPILFHIHWQNLFYSSWTLLTLRLHDKIRTTEVSQSSATVNRVYKYLLQF